MMKTVKHTFNTLGDHGSDLARSLGDRGSDLARSLGSFGSDTAVLARRFGTGTQKFARRVGPRNGLIGLAVLAAAVGGSIFLIRYLKARAADAGVDVKNEETDKQTAGNRRKQHPIDAQLQH